VIMAIELGWGNEDVDDRVLGGALAADLNTNAFFGGAQLRWVPIDFLQPYARVVGGAALIDMELSSFAPSETFADDGGEPFDSLISPFASLGLGLTLRTPARAFENRRGDLASLSTGVMIEGGYTLAAPVETQLDGRGPDRRDIALTEAEFGELERSGPYVRASLFVRF